MPKRRRRGILGPFDRLSVLESEVAERAEATGARAGVPTSDGSVPKGNAAPLRGSGTGLEKRSGLRGLVVDRIRPVRTMRSSSASKSAASSCAESPGHTCSGFAAPWACCCSDVRSGSCGLSTRGPNMSRSSLMRNWCSIDCGRTRLTTTPRGWQTRRETAADLLDRAQRAVGGGDGERVPARSRPTTRSLAAHAVRVRAFSEGAQSMRTRSYSLSIVARASSSFQTSRTLGCGRRS